MKGRKLLALLLSGAFAQAEPGPCTRLDEAEALILQMEVNRVPLGEAMLAYPCQGEVLIPFGEFCRLLSFGIRVDAPQGRAEGYFVTEKRRFLLDLKGGFAKIEGKHIPLGKERAVAHNREIFVSPKLLSQWFPLEAKVDLKMASVLIKPKEKLPIQDQWEREGRYQGLALGTGREGAPIGDFRPQPYGFFDIPFVDMSLGYSRSQHYSSTQPSGSLTTGGDLLWMSSAITVNRDSEGSFKSSRYTLFMEDPRRELLGPLHAQRLELGNLRQAPSMDLAGALPDGRGALVDNYPLSYRTKFAARTFQGRLQEGWTVELYQNNSLAGVQRPRGDGWYEFRDVPLRFGLNLFKLVFHGPMGEIRQETHRVDIANEQPPPGTFYYRAASLRPLKSDDPPASGVSQAQMDQALARTDSFVEGEYGLTHALSASAALARVSQLDGNHDYAVVGLRNVYSYLSLQGSAAQDRKPDGTNGLAAEGILRTGYEYSSFSLRRSEFRRGFQKIASPGSTGNTRPIRTETVGDLFGTLEWHGRPLGVSLSMTKRLHQDQSDTLETKVQASISFSAITMTQSVSQTRDSQIQGAAPIETSLYVSSFGGPQLYQGQLTAKRQGSETKITSWEGTTDRLLPSGLVLRLGAKGASGKLKDTAILASLNKTQGSVGFGAEGQYSKNGGYAVNLRLQASFGREPRTGRWAANAQPIASQGAVSAVGFLDKNSNGSLDEREQVLEETRFKLGGMPAESNIKDERVTFRTNLSRSQELLVQLSETSLEDPAMRATIPGIRIIPRSGKVARIDIPVSQFGEIVGTTRIRKAGKLSDFGGLELELLKANGDRLRLMRSAYDGFFEFRDLPLGDYTLRVSPEEVKRLGLKPPPSRTFHIDGAKNLFEGQDMVVETSAPTPEPREGAYK